MIESYDFGRIVIDGRKFGSDVAIFPYRIDGNWWRKAATKIATLELAYRIAKSEGVLFPYIGNVSGHPYDNTYCPRCQNVVIRRAGCFVSQYNEGS
jgi:hypothetical protein